MAIVKVNAHGVSHEQYAAEHPCNPGFFCGVETVGHGCFNCGFNTERDPGCTYVVAQARP